MSLELNDQFFSQVLTKTNDGGYYVFPSESQIYQVRDGKFHGTPKAVEVMKKYTTEKFHDKICIEK